MMENYLSYDPYFPTRALLIKPSGKSHVMGSEWVDLSGSIKTSMDLLVSALYFYLYYGGFLALFKTEKEVI